MIGFQTFISLVPSLNFSVTPKHTEEKAYSRQESFTIGMDKRSHLDFDVYRVKTQTDHVASGGVMDVFVGKGFYDQMDYDYESFLRRSETDRERFISAWDNAENPENYLELTYSPESAEAAKASISEALSKEYDLTEGTRTLDGAGDCIWMEASVIKGTNNMAPQIQTVYIIPAPDGCRIATAHCAIEASEGFGRRFAYMLNTLSVISR
jgi:hypothetical protein